MFQYLLYFVLLFMTKISKKMLAGYKIFAKLNKNQYQPSKLTFFSLDRFDIHIVFYYSIY